MRDPKDNVVSEVAHGVATITLNRPHRHNAWTGRMERAYREAMAAADADSSVRVIVVTGAGRGFCVGADAAALDRIRDAGEYPTVLDAPKEAGFAWQLRLGKPVIAAVNGPAAGIGFALACFCDLRFATPDAKLTTSFGRLGLPAEVGVSWLLPRLIGFSRAAELLYSSRVVLAEEARGLGLVDRVCSLEQTMDYARTIAAEISPASLRTMKAQLWHDLEGPLGTSITESMELMFRMVGEPDFKEGVAALLEKRPPAF